MPSPFDFLGDVLGNLTGNNKNNSRPSDSGFPTLPGPPIDFGNTMSDNWNAFQKSLMGGIGSGIQNGQNMLQSGQNTLGRSGELFDQGLSDFGGLINQVPQDFSKLTESILQSPNNQRTQQQQHPGGGNNFFQSPNNQRTTPNSQNDVNLGNAITSGSEWLANQTQPSSPKEGSFGLAGLADPKLWLHNTALFGENVGKTVSDLPNSLAPLGELTDPNKHVNEQMLSDVVYGQNSPISNIAKDLFDPKAFSQMVNDSAINSGASSEQAQGLAQSLGVPLSTLANFLAPGVGQAMAVQFATQLVMHPGETAQQLAGQGGDALALLGKVKDWQTGGAPPPTTDDISKGLNGFASIGGLGLGGLHGGKMAVEGLKGLRRPPISTREGVAEGEVVNPPTDAGLQSGRPQLPPAQKQLTGGTNGIENNGQAGQAPNPGQTGVAGEAQAPTPNAPSRPGEARTGPEQGTPVPTDLQAKIGQGESLQQAGSQSLSPRVNFTDKTQNSPFHPEIQDHIIRSIDRAGINANGLVNNINITSDGKGLGAYKTGQGADPRSIHIDHKALDPQVIYENAHDFAASVQKHVNRVLDSPAAENAPEHFMQSIAENVELITNMPQMSTAELATMAGHHEVIHAQITNYTGGQRSLVAEAKTLVQKLQESPEGQKWLGFAQRLGLGKQLESLAGKGDEKSAKEFIEHYRAQVQAGLGLSRYPFSMQSGDEAYEHSFFNRPESKQAEQSAAKHFTEFVSTAPISIAEQGARSNEVSGSTKEEPVVRNADRSRSVRDAQFDPSWQDAKDQFATKKGVTAPEIAKALKIPSDRAKAIAARIKEAHADPESEAARELAQHIIDSIETPEYHDDLSESIEQNMDDIGDTDPGPSNEALTNARATRKAANMQSYVDQTPTWSTQKPGDYELQKISPSLYRTPGGAFVIQKNPSDKLWTIYDDSGKEHGPYETFRDAKDDFDELELKARVKDIGKINEKAYPSALRLAEAMIDVEREKSGKQSEVDRQIYHGNLSTWDQSYQGIPFGEKEDVLLPRALKDMVGEFNPERAMSVQKFFKGQGVRMNLNRAERIAEQVKEARKASGDTESQTSSTPELPAQSLLNEAAEMKPKTREGEVVQQYAKKLLGTWDQVSTSQDPIGDFKSFLQQDLARDVEGTIPKHQLTTKKSQNAFIQDWKVRKAFIQNILDTLQESKPGTPESAAKEPERKNYHGMSAEDIKNDIISRQGPKPVELKDVIDYFARKFTSAEDNNNLGGRLVRLQQIGGAQLGDGTVEKIVNGINFKDPSIQPVLNSLSDDDKHFWNVIANDLKDPSTLQKLQTEGQARADKARGTTESTQYNAPRLDLSQSPRANEYRDQIPVYDKQIEALSKGMVKPKKGDESAASKADQIKELQYKRDEAAGIVKAFENGAENVQAAKEVAQAELRDKYPEKFNVVNIDLPNKGIPESEAIAPEEPIPQPVPQPIEQPTPAVQPQAPEATPPSEPVAQEVPANPVAPTNRGYDVAGRQSVFDSLGKLQEEVGNIPQVQAPIPAPTQPARQATPAERAERIKAIKQSQKLLGDQIEEASKNGTFDTKEIKQAREDRIDSAAELVKAQKEEVAAKKAEKAVAQPEKPTKYHPKESPDTRLIETPDDMAEAVATVRAADIEKKESIARNAAQSRGANPDVGARTASEQSKSDTYGAGMKYSYEMKRIQGRLNDAQIAAEQRKADSLTPGRKVNVDVGKDNPVEGTIVRGAYGRVTVDVGGGKPISFPRDKVFLHEDEVHDVRTEQARLAALAKISPIVDPNAKIPSSKTLIDEMKKIAADPNDGARERAQQAIAKYDAAINGLASNEEAMGALRSVKNYIDSRDNPNSRLNTDYRLKEDSKRYKETGRVAESLKKAEGDPEDKAALAARVINKMFYEKENLSLIDVRTMLRDRVFNKWRELKEVHPDLTKIIQGRFASVIDVALSEEPIDSQTGHRDMDIHKVADRSELQNAMLDGRGKWNFERSTLEARIAKLKRYVDKGKPGYKKDLAQALEDLRQVNTQWALDQLKFQRLFHHDPEARVLNPSNGKPAAIPTPEDLAKVRDGVADDPHEDMEEAEVIKSMDNANGLVKTEIPNPISVTAIYNPGSGLPPTGGGKGKKGKGKPDDEPKPDIFNDEYKEAWLDARRQGGEVGRIVSGMHDFLDRMVNYLDPRAVTMHPTEQFAMLLNANQGVDARVERTSYPMTRLLENNKELNDAIRMALDGTSDSERAARTALMSRDQAALTTYMHHYFEAIGRLGDGELWKTVTEGYVPRRIKQEDGKGGYQRRRMTKNPDSFKHRLIDENTGRPFFGNIEEMKDAGYPMEESVTELWKAHAQETAKAFFIKRWLENQRDNIITDGKGEIGPAVIASADYDYMRQKFEDIHKNYKRVNGGPMQSIFANYWVHKNIGDYAERLASVRDSKDLAVKVANFANDIDSVYKMTKFAFQQIHAMTMFSNGSTMMEGRLSWLGAANPLVWRDLYGRVNRALEKEEIGFAPIYNKKEVIKSMLPFTKSDDQARAEMQKDLAKLNEYRDGLAREMAKHIEADTTDDPNAEFLKRELETTDSKIDGILHKSGVVNADRLKMAELSDAGLTVQRSALYDAMNVDEEGLFAKILKLPEKVPGYKGYEDWLWQSVVWKTQAGIALHMYDKAVLDYAKRKDTYNYDALEADENGNKPDPFSLLTKEEKAMLASDAVYIAKNATGIYNKHDLSRNQQLIGRAAFLSMGFTLGQYRTARDALNLNGVGFRKNVLTTRDDFIPPSEGPDAGRGPVKPEFTKEQMRFSDDFKNQMARRLIGSGILKMAMLSFAISTGVSYMMTHEWHTPIDNFLTDPTHTFDIRTGTDPVTGQPMWASLPFYAFQRELINYALSSVKAVEEGKGIGGAVKAPVERFTNKNNPGFRAALESIVGTEFGRQMAGFKDPSIDGDNSIRTLHQALNNLGVPDFGPMENRVIFALRTLAPFSGTPSESVERNPNTIDPKTGQETIGTPKKDASGKDVVKTDIDSIKKAAGYGRVGLDTIPQFGMGVIGSSESQGRSVKQYNDDTKLHQQSIDNQTQHALRAQVEAQMIEAANRGDFATVAQLRDQQNMTNSQVTQALLHGVTVPNMPNADGSGGTGGSNVNQIVPGMLSNPKNTPAKTPNEHVVIDGYQLNSDQSLAYDKNLGNRQLYAIQQLQNDPNFKYGTTAEKATMLTAYTKFADKFTKAQALNEITGNGPALREADFQKMMGQAIRNRSDMMYLAKGDPNYKSLTLTEQNAILKRYTDMSMNLTWEGTYGKLKNLPQNRVDDVIRNSISYDGTASKYVKSTPFYQNADPQTQQKMLTEYTKMSETLVIDEATGKGMGEFGQKISFDQIPGYLESRVNTQESALYLMHNTHYYQTADLKTQEKLDARYKTLSKNISNMAWRRGQPLQDLKDVNAAFTQGPQQVLTAYMMADQGYRDLMDKYGGPQQVQQWHTELAAQKKIVKEDTAGLSNKQLTRVENAIAAQYYQQHPGYAAFLEDRKNWEKYNSTGQMYKALQADQYAQGASDLQHIMSGSVDPSTITFDDQINSITSSVWDTSTGNTSSPAVDYGTANPDDTSIDMSSMI